MKKNKHMSKELRAKISEANKHSHNMTEIGKLSLSNSRKGKSPKNKGKICISNIELNIKKYIDKNDLDLFISNGWKRGDWINKSNSSDWYKNPKNRDFHSKRTSEGTKRALQRPEVQEKLHSSRHINNFIANRRKNWHEPTKYELILYDFLTNLGFIYQKKHYINSKLYVSDFANDNLMIWIEIDGRTHNNLKAKELDIQRDKILTNFGYKVLRFKNKEVQDNTDKVKSLILSCIKEVV